VVLPASLGLGVRGVDDALVVPTRWVIPDLVV